MYTKYLYAPTTAGEMSSLCENITINNERERQLGISRVNKRDRETSSRNDERDLLQQLGISRVDKRDRVTEFRGRRT